MRHTQTRSLAACSIAFLCACVPAFAAPSYEAKPLTREQALADLDLAERTLSTLHAGYDRYTGTDVLESAFDRVRDSVAEGTTDEALYLRLSLLLPLIRCDHTKAEYPEALAAHREANATHLPVRTHVFDGRVYAGANAVEGLDEGDEVLAINGVPAPRLFDEVAPFIPADGYTEHARRHEFGSSGEFMGPALDAFLPLMYGWSGEFALRVRTGDAPPRELVAPAITFAEQREMIRAAEGAASDFDEAVSVERIGDDAAVLRVDTFVNYRRPVDAMKVIGEAIRPLNEAGVGHLIVDLRRNGGGSDDAAIALVRHVIAAPYETADVGEVRTVPIPQDLHQYLNTWDRSVFAATPEMFDRQTSGRWRFKGAATQTVEPAPDHFRGRVTLLSSGANSSGSTMLLADLQQRAGLRVVGERTGGSVAGCTAGIIVFLELPNSKIRVRVPLVRTVTGLEAEALGMGLTPDVEAVMTRADYFAGRDPALEAALALPAD